MEEEEIHAGDFTVDSVYPLPKMLCTVLTLNNPRKVAVVTWLSRIGATTMPDFAMIPNRLMNYSDIDPEIPDLGEYNVKKVQFLQQCVATFTSTGVPDDDPRSWTKETFNSAFINLPEEAANPPPLPPRAAAQVGGEASNVHNISKRSPHETMMGLRTKLAETIKGLPTMTHDNVNTVLKETYSLLTSTPLQAMTERFERTYKEKGTVCERNICFEIFKRV